MQMAIENMYMLVDTLQKSLTDMQEQIHLLEEDKQRLQDAVRDLVCKNEIQKTKLAKYRLEVSRQDKMIRAIQEVVSSSQSSDHRGDDEICSG